MSVVLLSGCIGGIGGMKDGPVYAGDTVYLTYTARYRTDNEIFRQEEEPVAIRVGEETLLPYVEGQLLDMNVGETKTFIVPSFQGYGYLYDRNLFKQTALKYFVHNNIGPEVGDTVNLNGGQGIVVAIKEEEDPNQSIISIDLNPRHTWQDLIYTVNIHQIGGKELTEENANRTDFVEVDQASETQESSTPTQ